MTPDELKKALNAAGWRFAAEHSNTGVEWYAYKTLEAAADCLCNEKPPSLTLKPWSIARPDDAPYQSVEFTVTGEAGKDTWVTFKVYSIAMDRAIEMIPRATNILLAAWNAATLADSQHAPLSPEDAAKLESVTVGETINHAHLADVLRAQKQVS